MNKSLLKYLLMPLMLLAGANASAGLLRDDDAPAQPAEESALQLPPAPKQDDLLRYDVSAASTMNFMIDAKSVSITDTYVVRYTSVITSPSGATNISYEGVNCKTAERKLYASGRPDGSWNAFTEASWKPLSNAGAIRYPVTLMQDYFCNGETVAGKVATIVERLKRKKPMR
jgi:hypothetical protein